MFSQIPHWILYVCTIIVAGAIVLFALFHIAGAAYAGWLWLKYFVKERTELIHHYNFYVRQRRIPTEKLRELWMQYRSCFSPVARRQIFRYRARNIADIRKRKINDGEYVSALGQSNNHAVVLIVVLALGLMTALTSCLKSPLVFPIGGGSGSHPPVAAPDTIADTAFFKLKVIGTDNPRTNTNEIILLFNHNDKLPYTPGQDAPWLQGFGNLQSYFALDSMNVVIKHVPYKRNMSLTEGILSKGARPCQMFISYWSKMPSYARIWVRDKFTGDSTELLKDTSKHYNFAVTTDPASQGKRFDIVIRNSNY